MARNGAHRAKPAYPSVARTDRFARISADHGHKALTPFSSHSGTGRTRGTDGSNPLPSSGESANFRFLSGGTQPRRLLLEKRRGPGDPVHGGTIYLRCADLALAVEELRARGVTFSLGPHLIARMDDHETNLR